MAKQVICFRRRTRMRVFAASLLATTLLVSQAFADETANSATQAAPLAPGKPAGVQKADLEMGGVLLVGGLLVIAGAIALIASGTQGHSSTTTTG
jgi:hypothetical protein